MLFNSVAFAVFLPVVFWLYWLIGQRSLKGQNLLVLVASYVFYGWWDWRFLILLFLTSSFDFLIGLSMSSGSRRYRRSMLGLSLAINFGVLGYYKYCGFFVDSFAHFLGALGFQANITSLQIILPVGISFYTFQSVSYVIDVYRNQLKPTNNVIAFLSFVSFFPPLVAGPIERAPDLLPQFLTGDLSTWKKQRTACG